MPAMAGPMNRLATIINEHTRKRRVSGPRSLVPVAFGVTGSAGGCVCPGGSGGRESGERASNGFRQWAHRSTSAILLAMDKKVKQS